MNVNRLEKVIINHSEQWLLVRGKNADSPLILHIQAGPGLPMIPEARTMGKLLHLEKDFLVAYWDQRACGKSYRKGIDPSAITLRQLADDVIVCSQHLLKTYEKNRLTLLGYSIGATIGLLTAARKRNLYDNLFLVGIDVDIPRANAYAVEFAIYKAKEKNDPKLISQATSLQGLAIENTKEFQRRARILTDLGGIQVNSSYQKLMLRTLSNMVLSKAYRWIDIIRTMKGMEFSQNVLLPELNQLKLFEQVKTVHVPVHFVQGKLDGVAHWQVARAYFDFLSAPEKTWDLFESSAHMPHYDEPDAFARLIKKTLKK